MKQTVVEGKTCKLGIKRNRKSRQHRPAAIDESDRFEDAIRRKFKSLVGQDLMVFTETIKSNDTIQIVRIKPKQNVLVWMLPRAMPTVEHDKPVETLASELFVQNALQMTVMLAVVEGELCCD